MLQQMKFENDKYILYKHANGTTKLNLTFLNVCSSNGFLVSTLETDFRISMLTHVKSLQGFIKLLKFCILKLLINKESLFKYTQVLSCVVMIISQSKLFLNFNDVTIMEQEKQNQPLSIDHITFNSRRYNACIH